MGAGVGVCAARNSGNNEGAMTSNWVSIVQTFLTGVDEYIIICY